MTLLVLAALLQVSAEPSLLRLGADPRATVRVSCTNEPQISASVGRIERLRRVASDAFEADYLPPDDALPEVAIVSAIADGISGWTAIPLWGQGDAQVKTRPHASISVRIGAQTFGPVDADAKGAALVPVTVPPGVQTALHGKRSIDLHVPPARTLHLALGRSEVLADRSEDLEVYAFVVEPNGSARSGADVRCSVTRGQITPWSPAGPGLYRARWTLPPSLPGLERVTATLGDGFESVLQARVAAGPARTLELSIDRDHAVAGVGTLRIRAVARDGVGNEATDPVQIASSLGAIHALGAGGAELEVPEKLAGNDHLTVTARAGAATSQVSVALAPGQASEASFPGAPLAVRADGKSRLELRLDLRDRFGNAVVDAQPVATAEQGSARIASRGGAFLATFVPPLLHERSSALFSVRSGDALARLRIELLPRLRPFALGAKAGALSNVSGITAPLVGLEGAIRWDRDSLGLEATYAFLARSETVSAAGAAAPVRVRSRTDLAVLWMPVALRLPFDDWTLAWVSAGPSLAALWTRSGLGSTLGPASSALVAGAQAAVGVEHRFHTVTPFAELRFGVLGDPHLAVLHGPLKTVSFALGARLELL